MKKKSIFILMFVFFAVNFCCAYKDYDNGLMAEAQYLGTTDDIDVDTAIDFSRIFIKTQWMPNNPGLKYTDMVQKLTKQETMLLEKSLAEYSLKANEIYSVRILTMDMYNYRMEGTLLVVRINSVSKNGTYNYSWWGAGKLY